MDQSFIQWSERLITQANSTHMRINTKLILQRKLSMPLTKKMAVRIDKSVDFGCRSQNEQHEFDELRRGYGIGILINVRVMIAIALELTRVLQESHLAIRLFQDVS